MIKIEKTFLIKNLPFELDHYPNKELVDHYIPTESEYPKLRLRKCGESYEITKKTMTYKSDLLIQKEQVIDLSFLEYQVLSELPSKNLYKTRYYVPYESYIFEIDIFKRQLDGLILLGVDFPDTESMEKFEMPDFCLADITGNKSFSGSFLCEKTFASLIHLIRQYMDSPA